MKLGQHGDDLTVAPTAYEALRKIVNCFDRLHKCVGETDYSARTLTGDIGIPCYKFQLALDEATIEGKRALAKLPEPKP